uniref:Uncharacterized protein n=1 Tax=Anguilla anguilla TaxID=7936 RepID=A0A0E9PT18_ANGAN
MHTLQTQEWHQSVCNTHHILRGQWWALIPCSCVLNL